MGFFDFESHLEFLKRGRGQDVGLTCSLLFESIKKSLFRFLHPYCMREHEVGERGPIAFTENCLCPLPHVGPHSRVNLNVEREAGPDDVAHFLCLALR